MVKSAVYLLAGHERYLKEKAINDLRSSLLDHSSGELDFKSRKIEKKDTNVLEGLKEGFKYSFGFPPIRFILLLLCVISIMGTSYAVLMPVFAKDVLGGGPSTLGFLMSAGGIGALAATVYLASRRSIVGMGKLIPIASAVFSVALIAFSVSRTLWVSLIILAAAGFGLMTNMAVSNTILQTISEDALRGRVMSFYTMALIGTTPFGSLIAGSLAGRIGASNTIIIGGVSCLAASLIFSFKLPVIRKLIHPIYKKMGIIPEVASGLGSATRLRVPPED